MKKYSEVIVTWSLVAALGLILYLLPSRPVYAQDQNYTPGPHSFQVTLGASTTQLTATSTPCKQLFVQNNATHTIRVGDSTVTSSKGVLLNAGPAGGSITSGAFGIQAASNANQWYINGTNGDVIDWTCVQ